VCTPDHQQYFEVVKQAKTLGRHVKGGRATGGWDQEALLRQERKFGFQAGYR